jgi:hypothetical protein
MIYIYQHQRARHTVASPSLKLLSERGAKTAAISQSSQVVPVGFRAQASYGLPERDELRCASDEQGKLRWHFKVVESAERDGLAAPRQCCRGDSNKKHGHAVLYAFQRIHKLIRADASQVYVNDDDVRACATQGDERCRAARDAYDYEPGSFKRRFVRGDRRLVRDEKHATLIARLLPLICSFSRCCAHKVRPGNICETGGDQL